MLLLFLADYATMWSMHKLQIIMLFLQISSINLVFTQGPVYKIIKHHAWFDCSNDVVLFG